MNNNIFNFTKNNEKSILPNSILYVCIIFVACTKHRHIKKRNYFKAENYLILNDLTPDSDTIKTVVSRNGEIEKIVKLENGQEDELNNSILDSLTEKQRENLTEY